jgi:hypothetical protein
LDGDWTAAVTIAARFHYAATHSRTDSAAPSPSSAEDLSPRRVAQEIVSAFRESLEQGEAGLFDEDAAGSGGASSSAWAAESTAMLGGDDNGMGGAGGAGNGSGEGTAGGAGDKALEAAQLSLEYCGDAEAAVAILVLARRWTAAAQAALKSQRMDLLLEEVRGE